MLKITNTVVYGLEESIVASGYPMRIDLPEEFDVDDLLCAGIIDSKEFNRAMRLAGAPTNSGHANFLSGIIVQFDVTYPAYWTPQFQRYHFIQIISSQSKMHRLKSMELDSCCNEYVDKEIIERVEKLRIQYNENPSYENYMKLLSNCPMGLEMTMRVSTNYLQLKTIYEQRRNHKLKEDWGAFCNWILELPHFSDLIGVHNDKL